MKKMLLSIVIVSLVSGCSTYGEASKRLYNRNFDEPKIEHSPYLSRESAKLLPPASGPIPVAVYGFRDLTGQRKQQPLIASFSTAVTQGADAYLIKSLQDVGNARWFTVVERVGLDNLIKERQMIRQMREAFQGREAKPLPPLVFAGIIMEGGVIGYDSNTMTGGTGLRIWGFGASQQYQSDTVTVNLRTVSVATGEILTSVTVTKTVLSYMDKFGVLQFVDNGEKVIEGEIGGSVNESVNIATSMAVQAAVIDTIKQGARKGHWAFKEETENVERISQAIPNKNEGTSEAKTSEAK
jgi:curli production assembly/transport component CsgG